MTQFVFNLWQRVSGATDHIPHQFIKFCIVGVINTLTTFCIYILLTRSLSFFFEHYLFAETIAYLSGSITSFFLNKRWTFKSDVAISMYEVVRFYVSLGTGLLVNLGVLYALVSVLHLHDIIGVAVSLCVTIAWNFLFMKFWVFKRVV